MDKSVYLDLYTLHPVTVTNEGLWGVPTKSVIIMVVTSVLGWGADPTYIVLVWVAKHTCDDSKHAGHFHPSNMGHINCCWIFCVNITYLCQIIPHKNLSNRPSFPGGLSVAMPLCGRRVRIEMHMMESFRMDVAPLPRAWFIALLTARIWASTTWGTNLLQMCLCGQRRVNESICIVAAWKASHFSLTTWEMRALQAQIWNLEAASHLSHLTGMTGTVPDVRAMTGTVPDVLAYLYFALWLWQPS